MERIFYKAAMKSGNGFQIRIPNNDADALKIEDRMEMKITIETTGRVIAKREHAFKKKVVEVDQENDS